jgi:transcriptional regulator with XRE-family HTH domain
MLIEELEAKRKELGLSDAAFARRLGVSRPLWVAVREGKRSVGMTLLRGAAREFPDLDGAVLAHLGGGKPDDGGAITRFPNALRPGYCGLRPGDRLDFTDLLNLLSLGHSGDAAAPYYREAARVLAGAIGVDLLPEKGGEPLSRLAAIPKEDVESAGWHCWQAALLLWRQREALLSVRLVAQGTLGGSPGGPLADFNPALGAAVDRVLGSIAAFGGAVPQAVERMLAEALPEIDRCTAMLLNLKPKDGVTFGEVRGDWPGEPEFEP